MNTYRAEILERNWIRLKLQAAFEFRILWVYGRVLRHSQQDIDYILDRIKIQTMMCFYLHYKVYSGVFLPDLYEVEKSHFT